MKSSAQRPTSEARAFGSFVLDVGAERLWDGARAVTLRPKAWAVLCHLTARPGNLVRTDDLLEAIWPDTAVTPQTLTNVIRELRRALGDDAKRPRWVATVHGRGYRFLGDVRPHVDANGVGPVEPPTGSGAEIFVGRDRELARLRTQWEQAASGKRQLVFVTGEPGIGKTTLTDVFTEEVHTGAVVARGQCIEQHGESEPYLPLLSAVEDLARRGEIPELADQLHRYAPTWLFQLPWMISDDEHARLERSLAGATQTRMLREGNVLLEVLAQQRPLLLVLEDLHWSDPATLDFLTALARRREIAPLLVIGTFRPAEARHPGRTLATLADDLCLRGNATSLDVPAFDAPTIRVYLEARLADRAEATRLAPLVEQQSEGNPLFVRSVSEHLIEHGNRALAQTGTTAGAAMPHPLLGFVTAQLDAVPAPSRRLLEAASVVGVTFSPHELVGVLDDDLRVIETACHELARLGCLVRRAGAMDWPGMREASAYAFTHAVYRQLIYDAVPPVSRAALHRKLAMHLDSEWSARRPEIGAKLAGHYDAAGMSEKAAECLALAAQNAARRFAYRECRDYLEAALTALAELPPSPERDAVEGELRHHLGGVLVLISSYAHADVGAAYRRSIELQERQASVEGAFRARMGVTIHLLTAARYPEAVTEAQRLVDASRTAFPGGRAIACCYLAYGASARGELASADQLLEEGARALPNDSAPESPQWFDVRRMIAAQRALVLAELGRFERARTLRDDALARSRRGESPADLAHASLNALEASVLLRDHDAGIAAAELGIAISEENGIASYLALCRFHHAWLRDDLTPDERQLTMEKVLAERRALGDRWQESWLLALLAEVRLEAGDAAAAAEAVQLGLAFAERTTEHHYLAELFRIRGRLADRHGDPAAAIADFEQAVALAAEQGATAWELRAATDLAHAAHDTKARGVLRTIYARFADGIESVDLRRAREILDDG